MKRIIIILMMALLLAGGIEAKTPRKTKRSKQKTTQTTTRRKAPTPISAPTIEIDVNEITHDSARERYQRYLDGTASAEDLYYIGINFRLGSDGFPEDKAEALRYYYLSALQGYGEAENEVGQAYDEPYFGGNSVKQNYFEAAKWYARGMEHGDDHAEFGLGLLLKYGDITKEEFRIVTEQAGMDSQTARQDALGNVASVRNRKNENDKHAHFYGTWTSARGSTFTISEGPYLDLRGAGKFSGEWRSNGELHVSFGYPDEINLRYSNGYLYDRDGRMHWRVP